MKEVIAKRIKFLDGVKMEVTFQDGKVVMFDMSSMFSKYPFLKALENRDLFLKGKLDQAGWGIIWNDEIDFETLSIYYDGKLVRYDEPSLQDKLAILTKKLREKRNLSQSELAKLSKVDQSDISRLEKGEGNPTLLKLEKIFKALDYELSFSVNKKKRI